MPAHAPFARGRGIARPGDATMPDTAQYTLGLFDSSALGWTVGAPTVTPVSPNDEHDEEPKTPAAPTPRERGVNFALVRDHQVARGWRARARDNIAAITLSKELEDEGRAPTPAEQERLLRFIGFGATELAQTRHSRSSAAPCSATR
jgi:hypothetical protein